MTRRFRREPRLLIAATLVLGALADVGPAHAQPSADTEAKAFALFQDGVAALDRGDFAGGCPRFDGAMKLFPSAGTQLNIARCFEHDGRVASAWAAYQRTLVLARETRDPKRREALEKVAGEASETLRAKLPHLRLVVPAAPPGLKVTEDGQELPPATYGVPLPTDPGAHEIVATAPGFEEVRQKVSFDLGKESAVTISLKPLAAPVALPPGPPVTPAATGTQSPLAPPAPASADAPRGGAPVWAWVTGGLGVASIAAGMVFVGTSVAGQADINDNCAGRGLKYTSGTCSSLASANNVRQGLAGALAGAGGVAAVVAIVAIATAPPRTPAKKQARAIEFVPIIAPTRWGASLGGQF